MPDKDIILNGAEPVQALAAQLCADEECTQDGDLVRTLARGTSEKALWRIDGGKIAGGR